MGKKIFGLCSKKTNYTDLSQEKKELFDAARKYFDTVLLIDPQQVSYFFERGKQRPKVLLTGQDIADLDVLMIRSTGGREISSAMLAHTLSFCGCHITDPLERFSIGFASKMLTTIARFKRGVGSNSYIAFGINNAIQLLQQLEITEQTPILYKPIAGKKGQGVAVFNSFSEANQFVNEFSGIALEQELPFLFQTMENFVKEYRVLLMNGNVLGVVEKKRAEGKVAANAAQGGSFQAVKMPKIESFVQENTSNKGLLGVDVAIDDEGNFHIIESNRAPMWEIFQEATNIDVASEIMRLIKQGMSK
jgi:glutathione synthase/RimK-type ligase-like ATP-grasp enzyme